MAHPETKTNYEVRLLAGEVKRTSFYEGKDLKKPLVGEVFAVILRENVQEASFQSPTKTTLQENVENGVIAPIQES